QTAPIVIGPSANQDALLVVLAWVAAVPPAGVVESAHLRRARVFLPLLAVLEVLQAYPVAGTQIGAAAVLFTPVGALCLADGVRSLRADALTRTPAAEWSRRVAVLTTALAIALVAKFAWGGIVRPGIG